MKNFEKYIDDICDVIMKSDSHIKDTFPMEMCVLRLVNNKEELKKILLSEYVEPVKLTTMEASMLESYMYDIWGMDTNVYIMDSKFNVPFSSCRFLNKMKSLGYFEGVNGDETLQYIHFNYNVVPNSYFEGMKSVID